MTIKARTRRGGLVATVTAARTAPTSRRGMSCPLHVVEDFDISSHVCGTEATVVVKGDLDGATSPRLADELRRLASDEAVHVTVDLEGATFVALSGLRALMAELSTARRHGGDIVLQAPPKSLQKVLELSGADHVFVVR